MGLAVRSAAWCVIESVPPRGSRWVSPSDQLRRVSSSQYHLAVAGGSRGPSGASGGIQSVPPRGTSGWVFNHQVWQVISLTVQHIINGSGNALFIPESSFAALVGPRTESVRPKTNLPQLPRRVRLKLVQHKRLLTIRGDNRMDVICPYINCLQVPFPFVASFTDRRFNRPALSRS